MYDDLDAARIDGNQLSLFPPAAAEAVRTAGIAGETASRLARAGYLSFDPESNAELDPEQEAELTFVGALVTAGCDERMLGKLLAPLRPPYAYSHTRIYFDFPSRTWKTLPEIPPEA